MGSATASLFEADPVGRTVAGHRRGSVRWKVAVASTTIAALVILVVGGGLVVIVHRTLDRQVTTTMDRELTETASNLALGLLPGASAAAPGTAIQVVTAIGSTVVATSGPIQGLPVVSSTTPGSRPVDVVISRAFRERSTLNVARGLAVVAARFGAVVVYAVASNHQVLATTQVLSLQLLIVVVPSVILLTSLISWWVIGRSLRPVEVMRREVDAISTTALDRRVPVPDGDDEITRLARTMNEMLDRLEGAARRQRQFVADASHELRSPLASILVQVELARLHPTAIDLHQWTGIVGDEAMRLDRLVEDLLLLAKADERGITRRDDEVDLDEILLAEAARLRTVGRVRVDASAVSPVRLRGDRELLRRAVRNLVDNAERYAASAVTLGVCAVGSTATVTVADDGPGVPEALRATLFDRFVRGDASRVRGTGGTGLGLAIVAEIVASHDGSVAVDDAPGGGAAFEVTLPVDPED